MWNGRIASESTLGVRTNAARAAIGDSGEEQHLIAVCLQQVGLVIPLGDTGIAQEGIVKLNNRSRKSGRRGRCDILIISAHNRHWCLKHKLDKAIQAFSATRSPRRQNQW